MNIALSSGKHLGKKNLVFHYGATEYHETWYLYTKDRNCFKPCKFKYQVYKFSIQQIKMHQKMVHRSLQAGTACCRAVQWTQSCASIYYFPPSPTQALSSQSNIDYISSCLQCATLQKLSSMNRLCLQHCPLLYFAAIRVLRQKGREAGSKTVSAQWITFRPSHRRLGADPCQAMT